MSELPAFDTLLQSMGGSARMQAQIGNCGKSACAVPGVAFADIGASFLGITGILSALYHREKTGEGQKLETSLLQGVMAFQPHFFFEALDVEPEAVGGLCPYSFFDTKDDVIFIAAVTNNFFHLLCTGLGESDLANESKYKTNTDRMENKDELTEKLNSILCTKYTDEWVDILVNKGVPCAPALTHQEFWDHPQVDAMNMKVAAHHSKIGTVNMSGIPVNLDKTPGGIRYASPCLGEHTDEILREIGYDDSQIGSLRGEGVVK
jgi:crotonobetainyl-CoA:carnitine CoA-transferase CaiB-like acyl-CoA transferase